MEPQFLAGCLFDFLELLSLADQEETEAILEKETNGSLTLPGRISYQRFEFKVAMVKEGQLKMAA